MEGTWFMYGTGVGGKRGGKAQDGSDGNRRAPVVARMVARVRVRSMAAYLCLVPYLHTYIECPPALHDVCVKGQDA